MPIHTDQTLASIVLDHPGVAAALTRAGLDFCCQGDLTLAEACSRRGLDPARIARELDAADRPEGDAVDPRRLGTPALVEHIVERHHGYLRRTLPFARVLADKVAAVHGGRDARLRPLASAVAELADTFDAHLDDEEQRLFPALAGGQQAPLQVDDARDEHLEIADLLTRIRKLAADFAVPNWGCATYRLLMTQLAEVEADTFQHVHLENHVLFPRATRASAPART